MTNLENKFENNWLHKSLENLEKESWGEIPKNESYLVTTCHKLRKKPLSEFEIEDLRIMIGQNIGLKYLIPLAIEELKKNILAEGDFYEGDLLKSVLTSDTDFWKLESEDWKQVCILFKNNITEIKQGVAEYETGREIIKAFKQFESIN